MKLIFLALFIIVAHCSICPFNFGSTDVEVLGAVSVSNTGPSVITGSVGVSAGSSIVGFPPGITIPTSNNLHNNDLIASTAQSDATTLYNSLNSLLCTTTFSIPTDIGGMTLTPGVYCFSSSAQITGTLTLNGQNNPNSMWVFKIGSTLVTSTNSNVLQINGGLPCQVLWRVGSSATIGTNANLIGNVISLISITFNVGSSSNGRLWARTGSVVLDTTVSTIPPLISNTTINITTVCTTNKINETWSLTINGNNVTNVTTTNFCLVCNITDNTSNKKNFTQICGPSYIINNYIIDDCAFNFTNVTTNGFVVINQLPIGTQFQSTRLCKSCSAPQTCTFLFENDNSIYSIIVWSSIGLALTLFLCFGLGIILYCLLSGFRTEDYYDKRN